MPAINFQKQFAEDILAGRKTQTVRMKRRAAVGDEVALYWGMRTKSCTLIARVRMLRVLPALIDDDGVVLDGTRVDREAFARADGFKATEKATAFQEMRAFQAKHYGGPGVALSCWVHYWAPPAR